MALQQVRRRARRPLAPQLVDQLIRGDDVVGVDKEDGEQRTLLRAAQRQQPVAFPDLERAEDSELHVRPQRSAL
jgi:hypothetical protein